MRLCLLLHATAALQAPPLMPRRLRAPPCRTATTDATTPTSTLDGALPVAYGAASFALVAKAVTLRHSGPEATICCALAALATVTHAPTAQMHLRSVRRARETAAAEASAAGAAKRYNARAWRRAVVLRLFTQWAGLVKTVAGADAFAGAAVVWGANCVFWLSGGAHRRHDASGSFTPVPWVTAALVCLVDLGVVGCTILAGRRPPGPARNFYATVVAAGCLFGILEMLPRYLRKS